MRAGSYGVAIEQPRPSPRTADGAFISQLRQWQASDLIFERRFDGGHFLRAQQGLLDRQIILSIITCANLPQLCDEIS